MELKLTPRNLFSQGSAWAPVSFGRSGPSSVLSTEHRQDTGGGMQQSSQAFPPTTSVPMPRHMRLPTSGPDAGSIKFANRHNLEVLQSLPYIYPRLYPPMFDAPYGHSHAQDVNCICSLYRYIRWYRSRLQHMAPDSLEYNVVHRTAPTALQGTIKDA